MRRQWAAVIAVITISLFFALDIFSDYRSGVSRQHSIFQTVMSVLGVIGAGYLLLRISRCRTQLDSRDQVSKLRVEKAESPQAETFERRFGQWQLSPAERQVALLLLKGLPYQEIAAIRNASEGTIRQQALSIYRKTGLSGRSELAGFFLQDLLIRPGAGETPFDAQSQ